ERIVAGPLRLGKGGRAGEEERVRESDPAHGHLRRSVILPSPALAVGAAVPFLSPPEAAGAPLAPSCAFGAGVAAGGGAGVGVGVAFIISAVLMSSSQRFFRAKTGWLGFEMPALPM